MRRGERLTPTGQQQAVIDMGLSGGSTVVQALAGTGKTTVMAMTAQAITQASAGRARIRAIVYNKEAAVDGRKKFPTSTECTTIHAMAYAVMMGGHCDQTLGFSGRLLLARIPSGRGNSYNPNGPQPLKPWEAAERLDLQPLTLHCGGHESGATCNATAKFSVNAQLQMAHAAVRRFCTSDDIQIAARHIRMPSGTPPCLRDEIEDTVLCAARNLWTDLLSPTGRQRMNHDVYLKLFQLWITEHKIQMPYDVVILDEAQDSTPCVQAILAAQESCQLIIVGDSHQSLYGWRGAKDALGRFQRERQLPTLGLTRSWRFGPQIAEQGNLWLECLGSDLRIEGDPGQPGVIGPVDQQQRSTILCRTNAGVIAEAIDGMDRGCDSIAIVGGGQDAMALAKAIADLAEGRKPSHPSLAIFDDWTQLVEYVDSDLCDEDPELRLATQLAIRYGAKRLVATMAHCDAPEGRARLVLSTMHRSKGREWSQVTIGQDVKDPGFDEFGNMVPVPPEEMMLFYVACTRARKILDNGRLGFVHRILEQVP